MTSAHKPAPFCYMLNAQPGSRGLIASERVLEVMREIGTLLIAFTPLDFAASGSQLRDSWPVLLGFLVAGFILIAVSIFLEWWLR